MSGACRAAEGPERSEICADRLTVKRISLNGRVNRNQLLSDSIYPAKWTPTCGLKELRSLPQLLDSSKEIFLPSLRCHLSRFKQSRFHQANYHIAVSGLTCLFRKGLSKDSYLKESAAFAQTQMERAIGPEKLPTSWRSSLCQGLNAWEQSRANSSVSRTVSAGWWLGCGPAYEASLQHRRRSEASVRSLLLRGRVSRRFGENRRTWTNTVVVIWKAAAL